MTTIDHQYHLNCYFRINFSIKQPDVCESCECPNLDIDKCDSSPCQNGGSCTDEINGYTCNCADGYDGFHCENDVDECTTNPCQNGGTCVDLIGSTLFAGNGYVCNCVDHKTKLAPYQYQGVNCKTGDCVPYSEEACEAAADNLGLQ